MALFPQKLGTTVCALAQREGLLANLSNSLGTNWTEARLGMYFTGVDAHDTSVLGPVGGEDIAVADVSDYLTFGLKDNSPSTLPGESGSVFLGVRSTGAVSTATQAEFGDNNGLCSAIGYSGVTEIDGGPFANGSLLYPDPEEEAAYNGFYCVKFKITGRGTSSQSVAISVARSAAVSGTDYTKAALTQAIQNAVFGNALTIAWNTGVVARELPTAAWLRIPFYNFRIRVQAIMAIKITP